MCGNLGDPIMAKDTLGIMQYLRKHNAGMTLQMHTNGSARTVDWFKGLADVGVKIVFGIDGLKDTHALYRISTDYDKILKNAQAFIDAGGDARWDMLVFKHNEQHHTQLFLILQEQQQFKNYLEQFQGSLDQMDKSFSMFSQQESFIKVLVTLDKRKKPSNK